MSKVHQKKENITPESYFYFLESYEFGVMSERGLLRCFEALSGLSGKKEKATANC